jgi:hypothetical protein
MRKREAAVLALVALAAATSLADSPRAWISVCSTDGRVCAVADPQRDLTEVRLGRRGPVLWSIPGWHASFFVSDDGASLVVGPEGLNLLPIDILPTEPMLRFYQRGVLVHEVTLRELVPDLRMLRRTVAHLHWGSILGIDGKNRLIVELATGRTLAFDPATGARLPLRR